MELPNELLPKSALFFVTYQFFCILDLFHFFYSPIKVFSALFWSSNIQKTRFSSNDAFCHLNFSVSQNLQVEVFAKMLFLITRSVTPSIVHFATIKFRFA